MLQDDLRELNEILVVVRQESVEVQNQRNAMMAEWAQAQQQALGHELPSTPQTPSLRTTTGIHSYRPRKSPVTGNGVLDRVMARYQRSTARTEPKGAQREVEEQPKTREKDPSDEKGDEMTREIGRLTERIQSMQKCRVQTFAHAQPGTIVRVR